MRTHRMMRVGIYVGTWLAVCMLVAMCGSCAAFARPMPTPASERGLTLSEQHAAAVYVVVLCADPADGPYIGSGVLVSSTRILTAAHVAQACVGTIYAGPNPSDLRISTVDRFSLDNDLARLKIETALTDIRPASAWSAAKAGTVACGSTAFPTPSWSCGKVVGLDDGGANDIDHEAPTEHGNSGSGMYDEHGRLVAIMTQCYVDGGNCSRRGGRASSVGGKEWLRP